MTLRTGQCVNALHIPPARQGAGVLEWTAHDGSVMRVQEHTCEAHRGTYAYELVTVGGALRICRTDARGRRELTPVVARRRAQEWWTGLLGGWMA